MLEFVSRFPNIINVLAVIIGWWIINYQNNKRETRKEVRSALNEIQKLIAELSAEAIGYHTEKRNRRLEEVISSSAHMLSFKIQFAVKPIGTVHTEKINAYKDALMKDNFGGTQSPLSEEHAVIRAIRHQGHELSLELEEAYSSKFHGKNWFSRRFL